MGDYFKPWRRKIGVLTLVLACLFMAGWVRSLSQADTIALSGDNVTQNQLISSAGTVCWDHISLKGVNGFPSNNADVIFAILVSERPKRRVFWQRSWCGFETGQYISPQFGPVRGLIWRNWQIPYWSIVIPLTLLSAYQLLSRPRKPTTVTPPPANPPAMKNKMTKMIVVWIIFIGSIWLADVPSRWREWKEWRDINERNAKYDAMAEEREAGKNRQTTRR